MSSKVTLSVIAVIAGVSAYAEMKTLTDEDRRLIASEYKSLSPDDKIKRQAAIQLQDLIEEGGEMAQPGTPKGTVRYINLQKKVPSAMLIPALNYFNSFLPYDIALVDNDCEATLKIKIIDDANAPLVLVAPEDHWAQINVARLDDGQVSQKILASRIRKHMLRAFAFLAGGSQNEAPLFTALRTPKQLDYAKETGFPIDVIMRTLRYLGAMGLKPTERTSYRAVLEDGYDVAPTNDYQKAIYESVKKTVKLTKKLP